MTFYPSAARRAEARNRIAELEAENARLREALARVPGREAIRGAIFGWDNVNGLHAEMDTQGMEEAVTDVLALFREYRKLPTAT